MKNLTGPIIFLVLFFLARPVDAQTRVVDANEPSYDLNEIEGRIHFIQNALQEESKRAKTWLYSWHGAFAAFTVGQGIAIPFVSEGDRTDFYYGIGGDFLGHLTLLFFPPATIKNSKNLDLLIKETPNGLQSSAVLDKAEFYFRQSAENEEKNRNWVAHLGNALVNVGLGLPLGIAHDHWLSSGIFIASGIAVGEIFILTQPNRLPKQWQRYKKRQFNMVRKESYQNWNIIPLLSPEVYGVGLGVRF